MRAVLLVLAAIGTPCGIAFAQPIDTKTVVTEAVDAENRRCHEYSAAHPDIATSYGPRVSIEGYCESNLLVGSVAPDELVRLMVDKQFEAKVGQRRHDTGIYCLNLLMKR